MAEVPPQPIALTIAGSDPSGGAGIQADLKTFSALGVYGATVITALTAQNTQGVSGIHKVPVAFIAEQFEAVTQDLTVTACKTGMLGDADTVACVAALVTRHRFAWLVVDPVMVATSGDLLLTPDAIGVIITKLLPLADLVTPNLAEAGRLLGRAPAANLDEMRDQATQIRGLGCAAVLLKGGHGAQAEAIDVLATATGVIEFSRARIATRNTHGTGCTLAAAIVAGLAKGLKLEAAVESAKDFVWHALKSGAALKIGRGCGPVDHLFLRPQSDRGAL